MSDDKSQSNVNDRPEPAKPEPVDQAQQSRRSEAQSGDRAAPGRRPLFRT